MDTYLQAVIDKQVERTAKALEKNNMKAFTTANIQDLYAYLDQWIADGQTVSAGGSMTLFETDTISYLQKRNINFLNRYKKGITREETAEIYLQSFRADIYLTSSNAITEDGALVNIDGNGNRVAAMIYGPKQVIVIAGINKIVKTEEDALQRLKETAAPANNIRLSTKNPCTVSGTCKDCKSKTRICSDYVVMRHQLKDRIKVVLMQESYGY